MEGLLRWQIASVVEIRRETPRVKTITLAIPDWRAHRPGQHYDLRLTAPDGYQAQRSYSVASEPERQGQVDITVERIEDGEVSTYLHDVLVEGDRLQVRGPIGGYFVWDARMPSPLLLVAGGSGVVPLMAMIRHRRAARASNPTRLLYSSRTREDIIYFDELASMHQVHDGLEIHHTLTREQPPGWRGYARRIDRAMLGEVAAPLGRDAQAYICGPTRLVESAAEILVDLGFEPSRVKTERFGPTGG